MIIHSTSSSLLSAITSTWVSELHIQGGPKKLHILFAVNFSSHCTFTASNSFESEVIKSNLLQQKD